MTFEKELAGLINKYNMENDSDTPDFILAKYLRSCFLAFNGAVVRRERWYGREKAEEPAVAPPEVIQQYPESGALASPQPGAPTTTAEQAVNAKTEIDKLTTFIMKKYADEPGRTGVSESAVDVAIRLLQSRG